MSPSPQPEALRARHRPRGQRSAMAVTAGIAVGAVALATYAGTVQQGAPNTEALRASVGQFSPQVASDVVGVVNTTAGEDLAQALAQAREVRVEQGREALSASTLGINDSFDVLNGQAEQISEDRAAARAEAERLAAEQAAAEQAAAEQAQRERAEQEAAERAEAEQAAARSAERSEPTPEPEPAPAPTPAPTPAPAPAPAPPTGSNRDIARSMIGNYGWGGDQFSCLDALWQKESNWNHLAMNPSSGAYGIPQSLPGNKMASAGADWQTNPATQIAWGLGYISGRYGTPCSAWNHSQIHNWY